MRLRFMGAPRKSADTVLPLLPARRQGYQHEALPRKSADTVLPLLRPEQQALISTLTERPVSSACETSAHWPAAIQPIQRQPQIPRRSSAHAQHGRQ